MVGTEIRFRVATLHLAVGHVVTGVGDGVWLGKGTGRADGGSLASGTGHERGTGVFDIAVIAVSIAVVALSLLFGLLAVGGLAARLFGLARADGLGLLLDSLLGHADLPVSEDTREIGDEGNDVLEPGDHKTGETNAPDRIVLGAGRGIVVEIVVASQVPDIGDGIETAKHGTEDSADPHVLFKLAPVAALVIFILVFLFNLARVGIVPGDENERVEEEGTGAEKGEPANSVESGLEVFAVGKGLWDGRDSEGHGTVGRVDRVLGLAAEGRVQ